MYTAIAAVEDLLLLVRSLGSLFFWFWISCVVVRNPFPARSRTK